MSIKVIKINIFLNEVQTLKNKTMYFNIALWFKILYSQYQKILKN